MMISIGALISCSSASVTRKRSVKTSDYESMVDSISSRVSFFKKRTMFVRRGNYIIGDYSSGEKILYSYNVKRNGKLEFFNNILGKYSHHSDSLFQDIYQKTKLLDILSFTCWEPIYHCDCSFSMENHANIYLLNEEKETAYFKGSDTLYYKDFWLVTRRNSN